MNRRPPIPVDSRVVRPDYAAWPAHAPQRLMVWTFLSHLTGWALATTVLMVPCLFVLPRYEQILAEYRAPVPDSTRIALGAARLVRQYGIALRPVALAHSWFAAAWYARAGVGARRAYRLVLTLFVCAAFAVVILALFLPIVSITNTLTGGPAPK